MIGLHAILAYLSLGIGLCILIDGGQDVVKHYGDGGVLIRAVIVIRMTAGSVCVVMGIMGAI